MPDLKVTADHLRRDAYLYIRQSTLRQVAENGESTQRQYALRHRAIAAGWPAERIHVIDCDLGKSGSSAVARDGFQELVSEVALAKAGIVMWLEVSRLTVTRNGNTVSLSRREFAILLTLMESPATIHSKQVLEERLYGWQEEIESNTIEVHIHKLRAKLGAALIETVRGVGYRMGRA